MEGRWCNCHEIPQKPSEGAIRWVRGALKPQPQSLCGLDQWLVRPVSQSKTRRTPRTKNPSTTRSASALMDGQNPINEKDRSERSNSSRPERTQAPRIPSSETKSQHEASRPKPQGRQEADRARNRNSRMEACTYHTWTLRTADDTNRLSQKLGDIKWHVLGLCETNRRGEGFRELSGVGMGGDGGGGGGEGVEVMYVRSRKNRKSQMQMGWPS